MIKKKYPQWKKLLANPWVLGVIAVFSLLLIMMITLLVSHYLLLLKEYWVTFKQNATVPGAAPSASNVFKFDWRYMYTVPNASLLRFAPLLAVVIWLIIVPKKIYYMRIAYKNINLNTEGTARFTSVKEAMNQYPSVLLNDQPYTGLSGVPVLHLKTRDQVSGYHGKGMRYTKLNFWTPTKPYFWLKWLPAHYGMENGADLIDTLNTNSITVSGSQSGKTQIFTYPTIDLVMRATVKDSMIITDIKGNMVRNTRKELERFGYQVLLLNLVNTRKSMHYNPLELIKTAYWEDDIDAAETSARTFAYSLYHVEQSNADPLWEKSSIALFVSVVMFMCEQCMRDSTPEKVTLYSMSLFVNKYCTDYDENGLTSYDKMMDSLPLNNPAKVSFTTIKFSKDVTRSSIYTGFQAEINSFTSRSVAKLTASNDFDLKSIAFGEKPVAIFIVAPDYDDSNYMLMSTFIEQCSYVLEKAATESRESRLPRRVRYILEEVANIPTIGGLTRYMNVGLERGLLFHLVVQSLAQMKDKYGEKGQEALFSACGNKYYLMGDGKDDAETFSDLLGKTTVVSGTRHGDPLSQDKSYGESEKGVQLVNADELRQLTKGEMILIRTKHREDNDNNRIEPRPITANIRQGTEMLHAYEYLEGRFKSDETLDEVADELCAGYDEANLDDLIIGEGKSNDENTEEVDQASEPADDLDMNFDATKVRQNKNEYKEPVFHEDSTSINEEDIDGISDNSTPLNFTDTQNAMILRWYQERFSDPVVSYLMDCKTVEELKNVLRNHDGDDLFQKMVNMFSLQERGDS